MAIMVSTRQLVLLYMLFKSLRRRLIRALFMLTMHFRLLHVCDDDTVIIMTIASSCFGDTKKLALDLGSSESTETTGRNVREFSLS